MNVNEFEEMVIDIGLHGNVILPHFYKGVIIRGHIEQQLHQLVNGTANPENISVNTSKRKQHTYMYINV